MKSWAFYLIFSLAFSLKSTLITSCTLVTKEIFGITLFLLPQTLLGAHCGVVLMDVIHTLFLFLLIFGISNYIEDPLLN
jgi:hypothetical protein